MRNLRIVLLSGGSGKRLWPLSSDARPKQFIPLFETENGERETMARRVFRQIREVCPDATITVATGAEHEATVREEFGDAASVCVEPCRRDTFPATALAASFLRDVVGVGEDESVVVCPIDSFVDASYFRAAMKLSELAATSDANLVLMGIEPTEPSEKYGYIVPESDAQVCAVQSFKEKPDAATAARYVEQGALWNAGVFAFRLGRFLERARREFDFADYEDLRRRYASAPKISLDYAIVEKEPKIDVLRYSGTWKDLGTWDALAETLGFPVVGPVVLDEARENVCVVDELDLPVLVLGLKNCVVAVGSQGVLVADVERSSALKPFVEELERRRAAATKSKSALEPKSRPGKPFGASRRVLDARKNVETALTTLQSGERTETDDVGGKIVWIVLSGAARAVDVDAVSARVVKTGDVVESRPERRFEIWAETETTLLETLFAAEISND